MKRLLTLLAFTFMLFALNAQDANVTIIADSPPPSIPEYTQPPCPNAGYLWVPGYWSYAPAGYYWVPGVWVSPPRPRLLWTPGYWSFTNGHYGWYDGYWGPTVGYYGGVYYGGGYYGSNYCGGRWQGNTFQYNTYVSTVNATVVHDTYTSNIGINNKAVSRSSFNGQGGVTAQRNTEEQAAVREEHIAPTTEQQSHQTLASQDKKQFAKDNKGKPGVTAMDSPGGQKFNKEGKAQQAPAEKSEAGSGSSRSSGKIKVPKTKFKSSTKVGAGIKPSRGSKSYDSYSSGSSHSSSHSSSPRSSSSSKTPHISSSKSSGSSRSKK